MHHLRRRTSITDCSTLTRARFERLWKAFPDRPSPNGSAEADGRRPRPARDPPMERTREAWKRLRSGHAVAETLKPGAVQNRSSRQGGSRSYSFATVASRRPRVPTATPSMPLETDPPKGSIDVEIGGHDDRVLAGSDVVPLAPPGDLEAVAAVERLGREVRRADLESDPSRAPVARLAEDGLEKPRSDPTPLLRTRDGEVGYLALVRRDPSEGVPRQPARGIVGYPREPGGKRQELGEVFKAPRVGIEVSLERRDTIQ